MRLATLLAAAAVTASTLLAAAPASAATYTLYIHGRNGGTPNGWDYWGGPQGGVNAIPVNYDGSQYISVSNPTVNSYLDAYCTNGNTCYIAAHSAGNAQIGYSVANNPYRWSIQWVVGGGACGGGTELSSWGGWASDNLAYELSPGTVRGEYNHDLLGDKIVGYVHTLSGSDWSGLTNMFISGNNDGVVPYHSSLGSRNTGSYDNGHNNDNDFRGWGPSSPPPSAGGGNLGGIATWDYTWINFVEKTESPHWYSVWSGQNYTHSAIKGAIGAYAASFAS